MITDVVCWMLSSGWPTVHMMCLRFWHVGMLALYDVVLAWLRPTLRTRLTGIIACAMIADAAVRCCLLFMFIHAHAAALLLPIREEDVFDPDL